MYLYSEWRGECFEDDDNDGLYHPKQLNPKPPEQERAEQTVYYPANSEVHTVQNPILDYIQANSAHPLRILGDSVGSQS
jgi:hypothetical protein